MPYVIALLLLLGVVWLVSQPLRRGAAAAAAGHATVSEDDAPDAMRRIDLEAARDSKYREIRDAELDHQTGKLSDEDYEAIDSTLRTEAIEILHELDELDEQTLADQDLLGGDDSL